MLIPAARYYGLAFEYGYPTPNPKGKFRPILWRQQTMELNTIEELLYVNKLLDHARPGKAPGDRLDSRAVLAALSQFEPINAVTDLPYLFIRKISNLAFIGIAEPPHTGSAAGINYEMSFVNQECINDEVFTQLRLDKLTALLAH